MNKIVKTFLLVAVLVFGATCVQAKDHGPSDGVKITRAIVDGITQILNPRPTPPPPRRTPPPQSSAASAPPDAAETMTMSREKPNRRPPPKKGSACFSIWKSTRDLSIVFDGLLFFLNLRFEIFNLALQIRFV